MSETIGIESIAEKARTNREHKGYTAEHDDTHTGGELVKAAICYAERARWMAQFPKADEHVGTPHLWPFEPESWKPSDDPIRNLVHAEALIVAEIERLQRAGR